MNQKYQMWCHLIRSISDPKMVGWWSQVSVCNSCHRRTIQKRKQPEIRQKMYIWHEGQLMMMTSSDKQEGLSVQCQPPASNSTGHIVNKSKLEDVQEVGLNPVQGSLCEQNVWQTRLEALPTLANQLASGNNFYKLFRISSKRLKSYNKMINEYDDSIMRQFTRPISTKWVYNQTTVVPEKASSKRYLFFMRRNRCTHFMLFMFTQCYAL